MAGLRRGGAAARNLTRIQPIADLTLHPHSSSFQSKADTRVRAFAQLLLRDCGLAERLAGLRRHFCMAAGDAALFFMDTAAPELAKKADAVSVPHLQQLLNSGGFWELCFCP